MTIIIDYKAGNVGSVLNMIQHVGGDAVISNDIKVISQAKKLILPGVGSFDTGMRNLADLGLIEIIKSKVSEEKVPILGICLGAQLMTNGSEEGELPGLGFFEAETKRFVLEKSKLKVPHMGWNTLNIKKHSSIFEGPFKEQRFYFVHKYYMEGKFQDVLSTTNYGIEFHSGLQRENIIALQFHPEKSHKFGMNVMSNFLKL